MSSPTPQQDKAIKKEGNNIIVSAGAGSGKTFVLKERVLRKIKNNVSVNDLIILTFTKKAASEMKERIRNILTENNMEEAKYVDSAYITTFDSFAHSLVSKYNYLLGINKDFNIIDSSIAKTTLNELLDKILEEKYKLRDESFINLVNSLCCKDDNELRKGIIKIYEKYTSIVDKEKIFDIDKYYKEEYVNKRLDEYEELLFNDFNLFKLYVGEVLENTISEKGILKNQEAYNILENISSLDDFVYNFKSFSLATNTEGTYTDKEWYSDFKKHKLDPLKKRMENYLTYTRKELKDYYLSTKENVIEIKNIILELDKMMKQFKEEHNSYEYNDIAFKAIELVKNFDEVRNELKQYNEILIDEYQDTNDIQDEFIRTIQNNNLYMVGDVKQSIYGFRNANPILFKEKYDSYSKELDTKDVLGYRIDLTANFRSRKEVIENINDIFSIIMTDNIGGANYIKDHKMAHGNKKYDNNIDSFANYDFQILEYNNENKEYKKDLIEAYIIANDIKKKMSEKRHAFVDDKFEDIKYKDFCILVDNSNRFETLKKVLEDSGIPAYISKEVSIKNEDEVYILKNLITCLTCIKNNDFSAKFKHAYTSIARSYIYKLDDNDIFIQIKENKFKESNLYKKLYNISLSIDSLSNKEILYKLINEFDIINKTISVGSVDERLAKLEYFIKQSDSLNKFGMDIYTMNEYFDSIIKDENNDLKMEIEQNGSDAVNIMTIHGSKGLEFNYVYLPYLYTDFIKDKEGDYLLDNNLGIIIPFNNDGIDKTFIYKLHKQALNIDIISERIRLLYVAITRARENFILVKEKSDNEVNDLLDVKSFDNIVDLIKNQFSRYIKEIDIKELGIKKNVESIKVDYKKLISPTNEKIIVNELNIDNKLLDNKHFSKQLTKIMDEEFKDILDYGTHMHYCFEVYDFNNDNLNELNISEEEKIAIKNFLKHDEVKDIKNAKTYKEHEIRFNKDGATYHGIIDLLVEYNDHFDIIDYKTSNIESDEYTVQLNGYKDYIESTYNKKANIYLYSIKNDMFKKLN